MTRRGRVIFCRMEEVSFGTAASDTIAEQVAQANATRVFLMVSGTLNRKTDEIEHVRSALGDRCAGIFDRMPAHTTRSAVVEASEEARTAQADLIVTIGGTSITDGAKAVQLCLANDIRTVGGMDALRSVKSLDRLLGPPRCKPPSVRQISVPTTLSAGEFSATAAVTDERPPSEGANSSPRYHSALGHPRPRDHNPHPGVAVSVDRYPRRRSLRGGDMLK
jgi:maleylacetate reductase